MQFRFVRAFFLIGFLVLIARGHDCLIAQQASISPTEDKPFPNAPMPTSPIQESFQLSASQATGQAPQSGAGTISGTVVDATDSQLQGAQIVLSGPPGVTQRTVTSGSSGEFIFADLTPGTYKVTASGQGMSTFVSKPILLHLGEVRLVPHIVLTVAAATSSVTVNGNTVELAEEQVQIAEQQRVFGVIPNFYSSYDWNAPPMQAKQKFKLSLRSMIDPVSFLEVAGIAGAEQNRGIFPAYGCCIEGYGKRYGAALANHVAGGLLGRAVYPSIFRQDPRYFYRGTGSVSSRAIYAMSSAVIARGDSGHRMPNYSKFFGDLSAGAISNLYYPEADRGAKLVFLNGLSELGANAVGNLIREFLLKDVTSRAKGINGQP